MSWNDYYRFRFTNLKHRSFDSELPGLRGWISGWGTLLVIAVVPMSGVRDLWSDLSPAVTFAVPLAGVLWLIAAIGESIPRVACYLVVVVCAGVAGTILWIAPDILARSSSLGTDIAILVVFEFYVVLVGWRAVRLLRSHYRKSAV